MQANTKIDVSLEFKNNVFFNVTGEQIARISVYDHISENNTFEHS